MIKSVQLLGAACFDPAGLSMKPLRAVNFFFGANGSGKSTIGRAINSPADYPGTSFDWSGDPLTVHTYNANYVADAFGSVSSDLPGVFVLGETSKEIHDELSAIQLRLRDIAPRIGALRKALGDAAEGTGVLGAIVAANDALANAAWGRRNDVPPELSEMFAGTRHSKSSLLGRVLQVESAQRDVEWTWADLVSEARSVLDVSVTKSVPIALLSPMRLAERGGYSMFEKPIVGSAEVELAPLINEMHNSDWVRQGRDYLAAHPETCPFCQQRSPSGLANQLDEYFDARFAAQISELALFSQSHAHALTQIRTAFDEIIGSRLSYEEDLAFKAVRAELEIVLARNELSISEKIGLPSNVVRLIEPDDLVAKVNGLIALANKTIEINNALIDNRQAASVRLYEKAWDVFVRTDLVTEVASHNASVTGFKITEATLLGKIDVDEKEARELKSRQRDLESKVTSSRTTILEINQVLKSVGFRNFSLAESTQVKDGYQLVREDGSRVANTLSEGERTFITFLYYYHRLGGVHDDQIETEGLVAVVDDPISSLDSDILFVVSTLMRRLISAAQLGKGRVRQVFLMTHNTHFHKEVTYVRKSDSTKGFNFFLVQKRPGDYSVLDHHDSKNPVRTNYTSLWAEVAQAIASPSDATVGLQNVLRRILENYFRVMGRIDDDELIQMFEGVEQVICRSLLSWVNEGSHSIIDELDYSPSDVSTTLYLEVFQQIFDKSGHSGHFDMMITAALPHDAVAPAA